MSNSYSDRTLLSVLEQSRIMDFSYFLSCNPVIFGPHDNNNLPRIVTIVSHRIPENIDHRYLFFYLFSKLYSLV